MSKKILQDILKFFTKAILLKYNPEVVAITGSVGKTSTAEAVYTVLSAKFKVRKNEKNYNNEIGIPLTVIGAESGGKSLVKWAAIFLQAIILLIRLDKNYPKILVLEMGADHPGDIKYLTSFIPVKIGIITDISPVHLEFFKTISAIAAEKSNLIKSLPKNGFAILNTDNRLINEMKTKTKAGIIPYGLLPQAKVKGSEIAISRNFNSKDIFTIQGISFKLIYQGKTIPVLLPRVLGEHLVYNALAAISVGIAYNINLHDVIDSLKNFEPPKGRMHLIPGVKGTLIIDDSYNSSPLAAKKALYQLSKINPDGRVKKIAVLGDMLELGSYTEQGHQEIGEAVVEYGINYLITVGEMSRDIVRGAVAKGFNKDNCFNFPTSEEAAKFLQQKISTGDLILVKGSQGVRMEKVVKEIMAEPQKAKELLVRQYKPWI